MPVKSLIHIPVYVWIPPIYSPEYKIEVLTSNGTTYDVTDFVHEGEYTDGVTETIGNFTFTVDNYNETYTNKWNLYDKVKIYMDYDVTATTLRFTGVIEKLSTKNETIVISGRSIASRVMGLTVTKSVVSEYTHTIIEELIASYCSDYITTTNIDTTESTDTTVTVNWYQRPFWECIQELCSRSGYDAYIDKNMDFNYFVSNTRDNTTECVIHDSNLLETGDFTPDLSTVKNRIRIYGATVEEMVIIWAEEDTSSIASYDVREEIINDSSIINIAQAQDRALYELSAKKSPPIIGEVTSLGLPTLLPGERVRISDPLNNLQPQYYNIRKFTHQFSNDDPFQTVLTIQKESSTISNILKKRITFETESSSMENPYEMKYSWLFTFDTESGVHTNTKIDTISGRLLLQTGQTSGNWVSDVNSLNSNMTECELRVKGESLSGVTYSVSVDNGFTWQDVSPFVKKILTPPGQSIKIKVNFIAATTQIDSLMLLYKK